VKKEEKVLLHLVEWNKKELTQTMEPLSSIFILFYFIFEELERANKKSDFFIL
jgi:hypothetical protein